MSLVLLIDVFQAREDQTGIRQTLWEAEGRDWKTLGHWSPHLPPDLSLGFSVV